MLRTLLKGFIALLIAIGLVVIWAITLNKPKQKSFEHYGLPSKVHTLQQNWTADIRQQVAHTSFGSRILPLQWLLHLEHPSKEGLLSDHKHMANLGFIPQEHATNNTYGLPFGFSIDDVDGEQWAGITCPACHTGLIRHNDQQILIDGGSALLDFVQFERDLFNAVKLTSAQPQRLERFAKALQNNDIENLKEQLKTYQNKLDKRLRYNTTKTPYGHGRLDAFGIIFNSIAAEALNIESNARSPDGPVSIPVLWDASHHDLVQWNGSAPNKEPGPLGQNVPTALAVYGSIKLDPNSQIGYSSSVNIKNLGYLQKQYYKLTSPSWPSDLFGAIDPQKAHTGKTLYKIHCQQCHTLINHVAPKRQIKSILVQIDDVGTDPVMANNFVDRRVLSGALEGKKMAIIAGPTIAANVQPIELVMNAAIGVMLKKPISTITAVATEYSNNLSASLDFTRKAYRARPLNGIWASAPYLHNGSIPTLWDLLQPEQQRPKSFYVGSHELDPVKIGFDYQPAPNTTHFNTGLYGNSNKGHLFGTDLSAEDKWSLIEYLKTL